MSALWLALCAAVLFAFGNQFSRVALRYVDSRTATLFQIGTGTVVYWLAAPFYLEWHYWHSPALVIFAVIGLFRPLVSANLGMAGTRFLGPTISATLSATSPLFGVALGVLLLGETLGWEVAVGTGAIVSGVVVLTWRRPARADWPLWALLLPVGATFIRSLAHAFGKVGLEALPDPFFAALIAYSVSFPLALASGRWFGGAPRGTASIPPGGIGWLIATGLAYSLAVLVLNTALIRGELLTVSPVLASSPLFTLLLGYFVFREERLGPRVAVAVALVVPGVLLIGLRG